MNNPKLEGIVNRFAENKKIEGKFWEKYQIFSNYLLLKEIYNTVNEEYPYESILDNDILENINFGGNSSTMAVDGCFFIYKKEILHLNIDDDELDEKLKKITDGFLNIVLIQTKSGKLDPSDLSTLSNCFLTAFTGQVEWSKFVDFRKKCNQLIQSNAKINFKFSCLYVTGKETDEATFSNPTFTVREDALKKTMKDFFWMKSENVSVKYFDDNKILDIWEEQEQNASTINKAVQYVEITKEIEIPKVGKILFGAISFGELMKIIFDKEKQKPNDLYGYNVRAEIEKSEIKPKIIETIKKNGDKFILLNNGITLIVDKQETRGAKGIVLENIRIVNGCQTCHAILETCKDDVQYDNLQVSIKIIETKKDEILLGDITYSSNNQNPVTKENLISIHPKMFELEKNYKDFDITKKSSMESPLFERRQGQYKNTNTKFVDMLAQAKAYISLWEKEPHKAAMYRDEVLDAYTKLRDNDLNFINMSIVSGILWYNIYNKIPSLYENARYQIFATIVLFELEKQLKENDILNIIELKEKVKTFDLTWLDTLNLNFTEEVNLAIDAIKTVIDNKGELIFPPSNKRGGIHYRKFYPVNALNSIFTKYKELKSSTVNNQPITEIGNSST